MQRVIWEAINKHSCRVGTGVTLIRERQENSGREKIKEITKLAAYHFNRHSECAYGFIIMNKYFGRRTIMLAVFSMNYVTEEVSHEVSFDIYIYVTARNR
jgi:hypothetical protein